MDKVVIITGGSRGIGAETALLAARQGYRICINFQSDEAAAQRVLDQVRALGAQAIAVRADVSIEDEVIALFHRVDTDLGRVTALVNNAGTVGHKSRVDEMSEFRILRTLKTNVLAPVLCAKHAILRMSPKHGGQGGSYSGCIDRGCIGRRGITGCRSFFGHRLFPRAGALGLCRCFLSSCGSPSGILSGRGGFDYCGLFSHLLTGAADTLGLGGRFFCDRFRRCFNGRFLGRRGFGFRLHLLTTGAGALRLFRHLFARWFSGGGCRLC